MRETFKLVAKDGSTLACVYCYKEELAKFIALDQYLQLECVVQLNRATDTVDHRPITPAELLGFRGVTFIYECSYGYDSRTYNESDFDEGEAFTLKSCREKFAKAFELPIYKEILL